MKVGSHNFDQKIKLRQYQAKTPVMIKPAVTPPAVTPPTIDLAVATFHQNLSKPKPKPSQPPPQSQRPQPPPQAQP